MIMEKRTLLLTFCYRWNSMGCMDKNVYHDMDEGDKGNNNIRAFLLMPLINRFHLKKKKLKKLKIENPS
jgi:hypothetical protein